MRATIKAPDAPAAIGPYSQAVQVSQLLFVSGQLPLDPSTGLMVNGDISAQTDRVIRNLDAILTAAGVSFAHVVRTTVFLTDLNDFTAMNEVYGVYFTEPAPARSTVQVAGLPKGSRVEIDLIASLAT